MSINRVEISGNLGREPELRSTASGIHVCKFPLCVNTRQKVGDKWEDKANWVDVIFFGKRAESINKYLTKGSHVTVAGRLSQNTWETDDGAKRSKIEVVGEDIDFTRSGKKENTQEALYDEDIPF